MTIALLKTHLKAPKTVKPTPVITKLICFFVVKLPNMTDFPIFLTSIHVLFFFIEILKIMYCPFIYLLVTFISYLLVQDSEPMLSNVCTT